MLVVHDAYLVKRSPPMFMAAAMGGVSLVSMLLRGGGGVADVDATNRHGQTPLLAAAIRGHLTVVRELIRAGADVDRSDRLGTSPLIAAVAAGWTEVAEALLDAGASTTHRDRRGLTAIEWETFSNSCHPRPSGEDDKNSKA